MKKYIISTISCVVICAILGIVIYFSIPKTNDLIISAQDVSVSVGQKVKLEYSSTISDAVLSFSVKDTKIAEVDLSGDDVYVVGCVEGETIINVLARYKDARYEDSVSVVVKNTNTTYNTPNESQGNDDSQPNDDNTSEDLDDTKVTDDKQDFTEDEVKIVFVEDNLRNCLIDGETITINVNKKAIFSIETNINGEVDIESNVIIANKLTSIGNKAFSLYASEIGEYQITFVINNLHRKTYTVKVIWKAWNSMFFC